MSNSVFKEELKSILASVDKAKSSSNNAQVVGRNGELLLIHFLNKYLPNTLKAVSGHFVSPEGKRSPHIDCMIVDTRYPLLAYNTDDSVQVMAHSVLKILELKTNLTSGDIKKTARNFKTCSELLDGIWTGELLSWKKPSFNLVAYRSAIKNTTIENHYFSYCNPESVHFSLHVFQTKDSPESGMMFHFEPIGHWIEKHKKEVPQDLVKDDHLMTTFKESAPVMDLYYAIIQMTYYSLESRKYDLSEIASHFNYYLDWSVTYP